VTTDVSWTGGPGTLFTLRVGAILVRAGRVLMTRTDGQDHWFLPGGRVKLGEPAAVALRRELREELDLTVDEVRIRVVAENFFVAPDGVGVHELGLYGQCATDGLPDDAEFVGVEGPGSMFRWVAADELAELDVRPRPVRDLLFALPEHGVHLQIGP
jgi:8-oxo-dGTP pyrophosphatase MutT (NUDIX family)